jgi:hypothetical protein
MLEIIAQQKHAISLRVSHCDYTPRVSNSVVTSHLLFTHRVKNAAPSYGTRKSITVIRTARNSQHTPPTHPTTKIHKAFESHKISSQNRQSKDR